MFLGGNMFGSADEFPSHPVAPEPMAPSGDRADHQVGMVATVSRERPGADATGGLPGLLNIVRWADLAYRVVGQEFTLSIRTGPRSVHLAHSPATGEALITNGRLGADLIRLDAGEGFAPHTHSGDHLLVVLGGSGTITYDGRIYATSAGEMYIVAGLVPHAVGAISEHIILAIGAPHKPLDSIDRMTPEAYETVTTDLGDLECRICRLTAVQPKRPHQLGCPHCPCHNCAGKG